MTDIMSGLLHVSIGQLVYLSIELLFFDVVDPMNQSAVLPN